MMLDYLIIGFSSGCLAYLVTDILTSAGMILSWLPDLIERTKLKILIKIFSCSVCFSFWVVLLYSSIFFHARDLLGLLVSVPVALISAFLLQSYE